MPTSIKATARELVEQLADDATWEDLMYQIDVRRAIESGLCDSNAGRVIPVEQVRKYFGLDATEC